ncbi:hypothetical protein HMPREF9310_00578 [Staphylococcus simulans ACS-120-V-Sch1]|uniref:Uncharacterized protein n=1 Tax=Staphylococcus simulans TaxID=1286 RepID=A0A6N3FTM5_STASI|nr:hypothetical protein HMPREF9310_00578 [Staphylococcus simulans ACS-120-V-Sch1]
MPYFIQYILPLHEFTSITIYNFNLYFPLTGARL